MARIFDNIDNDLLTTLRATTQVSNRSDFCVGYFNLRGWQAIDDLVAPREPAAGPGCRVLVGIQEPLHKEVREPYRQTDVLGLIDNSQASRLRTQFSDRLGSKSPWEIAPGNTRPACAALRGIAALKAWRDVERGLIQ